MKTLLRTVLSLGLLLASIAHAQIVDPVRPIPADALKAKMYVAGERVLNLSGYEYMLAPGGQILNEKNLIVQTQVLTGSYSVRVKLNAQTQIQRVWILTPAEDAVDAPQLKKASSWWWPF
ncbi:MAG: hypothetical protein H6R19_2958 [Proteobacteria bacterium]|nr:hypothetical protein [Pseudomonadota bacterium]